MKYAVQRHYIDFLGPYPRASTGKTMLLIVLYHFSKFVFLITLNNWTAQQVVKFLNDDIFSVHETTHNDNGKQFEIHKYEQLMNEFGVKLWKTAVYSPTSNQSELINRSIICAIRAYLLDNHTTCDRLIAEIQYALCNSLHETVKYSAHSQQYNPRSHLLSYASKKFCAKLAPQFMKAIGHKKSVLWTMS